MGWRIPRNLFCWGLPTPLEANAEMAYWVYSLISLRWLVHGLGGVAEVHLEWQSLVLHHHLKSVWLISDVTIFQIWVLFQALGVYLWLIGGLDYASDAILPGGLDLPVSFLNLTELGTAFFQLFRILELPQELISLYLRCFWTMDGKLSWVAVNLLYRLSRLIFQLSKVLVVLIHLVWDPFRLQRLISMSQHGHIVFSNLMLLDLIGHLSCFLLYLFFVAAQREKAQTWLYSCFG